jgi:hypothetical protein
VATICPKCGFHQDDGSECGRCGIIFDRYRPRSRYLNSLYYSDSSANTANPPAVGLFRRAYRIFRWVSLSIFAITIILILVPSPPPRVEASTKSAQRAEAKVREFRASLQTGKALPLEMDQSELNSWLTTNLSLRHPLSPAEQSLQSEDPGGSIRENIEATSPKPEPTIEEVQSSISDVKIELLEDSLRAYVAFDFHGKELSMVLEGRLGTRDGYLRLEPTRGQLGSLPLPAAALENATRKLFEDPKNREKFRLPPQIRDLYILKGNLLIIPQ